MTTRRPKASRALWIRVSSSLSSRRLNRSGRTVCSIRTSYRSTAKVPGWALRYDSGGETTTMSAVLDCKRKIYTIRDLPTLPVIAQKVMKLVDDDTASPEKLATIVSSDQALSARVLALANS